MRSTSPVIRRLIVHYLLRRSARLKALSCTELLQLLLRRCTLDARCQASVLLSLHLSPQRLLYVRLVSSSFAAAVGRLLKALLSISRVCERLRGRLGSLSATQITLYIVRTGITCTKPPGDSLRVHV